MHKSVHITCLNKKLIKWYLNYPETSHFGGVWEKMVRVAKEALVARMGRQRLTDEFQPNTLCWKYNRWLTADDSDWPANSTAATFK